MLTRSEAKTRSSFRFVSPLKNVRSLVWMLPKSRSVSNSVISFKNETSLSPVTDKSNSVNFVKPERGL